MSKQNKTKLPVQISVGKDFAAEEEKLKTTKVETSEGNMKTTVQRFDSIYQIWGTERKQKFPHKTEEEYKRYLAGLNKSDLQTETLKVDGCMPRDSRDSMEKQLLKKFRQHKASETELEIKTIKDTPELRRLLQERH